MSSLTLSTLNPEVKCIIWKYLLAEDLKNISTCNKLLCEEVRPLLWRSVKIKWENLESRSLVRRKTRYVKHTRHLHFSITDECSVISEKEMKPSILSNLFYILENCCRGKIQSISFTKSFNLMKFYNHAMFSHGETTIYRILSNYGDFLENLKKVTFTYIDINKEYKNMAHMFVNSFNDIEELSSSLRRTLSKHPAMSLFSDMLTFEKQTENEPEMYKACLNVDFSKVGHLVEYDMDGLESFVGPFVEQSHLSRVMFFTFEHVCRLTTSLYFVYKDSIRIPLQRIIEFNLSH